MKVKLAVFIVFTGLISVFLWGISIYNGWLKDFFLFGYNIYSGLYDKTTPSISANESVRTIKYGKFAYRLLTEINIPDNIAIIERKSFKGNKLTSVIIGSNVTLGRDAIGYGFEAVYNRNGQYAGLYTRKDSKSTEWFIWDDNFAYQNNNGNITITGYRGTEGAVVIPAEIHGNPVVNIGDEAFREKYLENVTIPDKVTNIGYAAFYNNLLANISIGNRVTNIGERAFQKNRLTRITIPNSVTIIGVNAFAENQITRIVIGSNVRLEDNGSEGILGGNTGFNTAYSNNNRREGIYTRPNTNTTTWTRSPR